MEPPLSLNFDSEPIVITCPYCHGKFDETISRLKYEPKLSCHYCEKRIRVNLLELHGALESVRQSSDDLLKKLLSPGK